MNRTSSYLLAAALLLLSAANVFAQDPVKVTVSTDPTGATFYVDGTAFSALTVFTWPKGSKHTLSCVPVQQSDPNANNGADFNGVRLDIAQSLPTYISGCTTWADNSGLAATTGSTVVVTADPSITSYKSTATILYKVILNIVNGAPGSPVCGSPGDLPANQFRPGLVIMNGQCYWNTTAIYLPKGTLTLNAYPYPGFVFDGWSLNLGPTQAYIRTYDVQGPVTIGARFSVAKRTRFFTDPPLFDLTVDANRVQTASANPCPTSELQPPGVPVPGFAGQSALCRGDFDFAFGSTHTLGAPTPQTQGNTGQDYVFDSWSIGGKQGAIYTPTPNSSIEVVVAKFVKAARVSFVTTPVPLALTVDGKSDWASYNFIWAYGSTYTVTPPPAAFDANGRKYLFSTCSNRNPPTQITTLNP